MSVVVGIFIDHKRTEISVYDQTTDKFKYRRETGAKLDQIISDLESKFKEKLIKIYVVESLNIDSNLIVDPLIHPLLVDDIDFTHYSSIKLTPEKKIVLVDHNSTLYEYVNTKNGVLEYKPVKCFEACIDMENHLELMLQFFGCKLNQLHIIILEPHIDWDSDFNYLEIIKKENENFTSYTVFSHLFNSQKAIIYGRYLSNDNVQSLLKLQQCDFLTEIELNTFNFEVCKVIPSYRAINTYKPQTKLMGIDLGANRIVVCISRNWRAELVKIDRDYSMPSVISFAEDKPIIGFVAGRHLAKHPELVLFDLKRLRDTERHLFGYSWPFGHCIEPRKSSFVFRSKDVFKQYSTVEIYQILFQKLKQNASAYQHDFNEGKDVNQAVITVPNFENKLMLADIYAAAESAELKILDIITGKQVSTAVRTIISLFSETHADLLYFLSNEEFSIGETVAVVDIGGGTGFIEKFSFEKGFQEKRDFSFFCGREINNQLERALRNFIYEHCQIRTMFNLEQKSKIEKIKEDLSFEEE
uniref:Uncharacterized protein n=1 Tax=Panagrolaimus sp. JU765 TaxID=591449 RepID=A0AC34RBG6_9BILA